jgi:NAD(P)-dependent dehydrogenase (short-subunit alcohol dehydrogenase family)
MGCVAMGAANSAVECLCRYFAVALARRKITVNAISPGWIEGSLLKMLLEAAQSLFTALITRLTSEWTEPQPLCNIQYGNTTKVVCRYSAVTTVWIR